MADVNLEGSVYIEVTLSCRVALSTLVDGWTDSERRDLLSGNSEARDELESQATRLARQSPDDIAVEHIEVSLSPASRRIDQTNGDPS